MLDGKVSGITIIMKIDAVLKIGGSLSHTDKLPDLCRQIRELGKRRRLLVIPGGGDFADSVRKAYAKYALNETSAHNMALLAMDQYGYLLSQLIAESVLVKDLISFDSDFSSGKVHILLPSDCLFHADPLPHSWDVTSDTIAAWVADRIGSPILIFLKDVDGIFLDMDADAPRGKIITELTVPQLAAHVGGVDAYLWRILEHSALETWVINGIVPERLSELLECGKTTGTRIPTWNL
jgi:5-(aminomethyl)-3-furanmethanol phosphate kinase